ncbi:SAP domain-containing ribonucleoprotein isoform X1 [Notothenia coriiceps]|uniref:SAP domain-containing ribonucleoprotein isoform X1 n=1 Tax=Notothenia coriiceps TaxID=8208 RepID=A0A6I9PMK3_9TELE|nr:PREDICTED: SAP domain-containing ribonucleoprotein isoform X1 [Notothenia coriiceps]
MAEVIELQKLKLAELRQECEARGLDTKGNKGELIARLQAYLEEHGETTDFTLRHEEDVDVDDVLAEDTEEFTKVDGVDGADDLKSEKEPTEEETAEDKKVVKIVPPSSTGERLQKRAERFNLPATAESKKAIRAARFGETTEKSAPAPTAAGGVAAAKAPVNVDQLKKRAERFGMNVSSVSQKIEEDEKLKKRKERFGVTAASTGAVAAVAAVATAASPASPEVEAKKMKRAERFGIV